MSGRLVIPRTALFAVAGFVLVFNWLVIPISADSPRFSDALGLGLVMALLFQLGRNRFTRAGLMLLPLVVFAMFFLLKGAMGGDMGLAIFGLRLVIALTAFAYLAQMITSENGSEHFLWGMVCGGIVAGVILYGQNSPMASVFNVFIPPGTVTWWGSGGKLRAVGIWQHPNAAAQVQGLAVAAGLSLAFAGPRFRIAPLIATGVVLGLTYMGTQNRALAAISVMTLGVAVLLAQHRRPRAIFILMGCFGIALAPFFAAQILGDRWFGGASEVPSMGENASERLETLGLSLELVLTKPMGHGVAGATEALVNSFGFFATHNSFVSIGLTLGLLPMLLMVGAVLAALIRRPAQDRPRYERLPLLVLCGVFFFEDSIFLPSMISALVIFVFWGRQILVIRPRAVVQRQSFDHPRSQ